MKRFIASAKAAQWIMDSNNKIVVRAKVKELIDSERKSFGWFS